MLSRKLILCALSTLLTAAVAHADVTIPKVLASHMVVQRNLPVHIWGWAKPDEPVSVSFRGETKSTTTNERGQWSVYLAPGQAGGPFDLKIQGTNTLTLGDILVGDVWFASGQSNMEFEMRRASTAAADLPKAANPRIRLLTIRKVYVDYPWTDVDNTGWQVSSPESAKEFSAVAWYFAREIEEKEHVPVGVIDSTWGGTIAEAWTSMTALGADPGLAPIFAARGRMTAHESDALLDDVVHTRQVEKARWEGKPDPQFGWHPSLNMWAPSLLYNGMVAPFTPFPIRGVLWYQGESNSPIERTPAIYTRLFRTMIEDWRNQWQIGDFPFLYVQLANFKSTPLEDWPTIREAQRKALELHNTGMTVTIDVGNPSDVHPTDKLTVGHRMALTARALVYGEQVEYSGPLFRQVTPEGNQLRVWFDHSEGLAAQGGPLTAFEVAGQDGVWAPADAKIDSTSIILTSPTVPNPINARYGWANSPECHLFNGEGLPASPFTSVK